MLVNTPCVVDLDGTIIRTDMLHESALSLLKYSPFSILTLIGILIFKGKAKLKQWIASKTNFDASVLPYNEDLLQWLFSQHAAGRHLVLCTASDKSVAEPIAQHLGIFDEIMASNGETNLEGSSKANALLEKFGEKGFDYVGNSKPDLEVWRHAHKAIIVSSSAQLISKVNSISEVEMIFNGKDSGLTSLSKVLRLHQWLKNVLLLVPLLAAHRLHDVGAWLTLFWAFLAFSLCASSVYIVNDLLDLDSDRRHPRKCKRPFASGEAPVWKGVVLAPLLFVMSCMLGAYVGGAFFKWLMLYFALTCMYSLKLKQIVLIDCLILALLYTLRIAAGAAAVGGVMSFWLLAFSVFLFLSLAFIKRFAELQVQLLNGRHKVHGRGYLTEDAPFIQMLGIASGFMSVLVLALYLNSPEVLRLYVQPEWVWGNVPIMVFWVSWLWLRAHRGEMHDDPLIFAVKDMVSVLAGVFFVIFMMLGSVGV